MEKDKLEKFIGENRNAFDHYDAPDGLWSQIEGDLNQSSAKVRHLRRYLSYAASIVVILGVGLLMGYQFANGGSTPEHIQEFAAAEEYYSKQVLVKWSELENTGAEVESVQEDIQQLDNVYKELKSELLANPNLNNEKVINALLENYRAKIEILELVKQRTEKQSINDLNLENNEAFEI